MLLFLLKTVDLWFLRNAHDQYTNPLARPLLIALQVVRTSFGFHLRGCMGSSFPPHGPNALLQHCALRKFYVTDGQNTRDKITRDRRSKRAWSNCVFCIPFILGGSPNECWLHTCDACVITTWRLGLRAPLVACNDWLMVALNTIDQS